MATIRIEKRNLDIQINPKKYYRIIELDFEGNKTVVSNIFIGEEAYRHLPEPMNGFAYQIQRIKCSPGEHGLKLQKNNSPKQPDVIFKKTPPFKPSDINIHKGLSGSLAGDVGAEIVAENIIILAQTNGNTWPETITKDGYEVKTTCHQFTKKFGTGENGLLNLKNAGYLAYDKEKEEYALTDNFFKLISPNKW